MVFRPNPFNPNSIVAPTLFAGRANQVLQVLNKLTQVRMGMPASFVLQGDRGIGKTALAKLIMYVAESNDSKLNNLNFLTCYYSVEKGQSFDSVLETIFNLMTDRMPETILNRLSHRLGNLFKNGKFNIGVFGTSIGYEGNVKASQEDPILIIKDRAVSVLSNIISGFEEISDENKKDGILLVIDEIHNLRDVEGAAQTLRAISTTLDVNRLGKISFMVIGYPEGIERFFTGDPSAKRHFDLIELSPMPREEAKEILVKGFKSVQLSFDENELDQRIDVAGGYPHSIQMIGHYLVDVDQDSNIDKDDWDKALQRSAEELARKDFSDMYDFSGKGTLRETVLNILALAGKPLSKQKLRELSDKKNIYTKTCLGELKKSGAIKELPDGMILLHSMLFRAAILFNLYKKAKDDDYYKNLIEKMNMYSQ